MRAIYRAPLLAGLLLCALALSDVPGHWKTASPPNGTSVTWTYDARNRATRVEHKKVSTNALIGAYDYLWNAQGQRSRETVTGTAASPTTPTIAWGCSRAGRRV